MFYGKLDQSTYLHSNNWFLNFITRIKNPCHRVKNKLYYHQFSYFTFSVYEYLDKKEKCFFEISDRLLLIDLVNFSVYIATIVTQDSQKHCYSSSFTPSRLPQIFWDMTF